MRARHTRFNRIATTVVAGMAFIAATAGATVLVLHNEGVIDLNNPGVNMYRAEFYVDGALVYETLKARGEEIGYGYEEIPTKDCDVDGQLYLFSGWDLTGEGLPDILPNRIYTNIRAEATFAKFGIPDIDWSKVDFNKLLDLLNTLNIDLESFMNFFGLTWEDMLDLLDIPVINYTTDYYGIVYLRNESFGDYNIKSHKWKNADYYSTSNISSGSVNPLGFTIDKAGSLVGDEANTVINLEYLKEGSNYPVMNYEKENVQNLNSEAYSLTKPVNMHYSTKGLPYSYLKSSMVNMLKNIPYSNDAIKNDEIKYRDYVKSHYTAIDEKYKSQILALLSNHGIAYDDNYQFIDKINKMFKDEYKFDFRMPSYPLTCDPPMYFLTDAKVGIGRHFAGATTLIYRALGIPARYVQGYVDFAENGGDNSISAIQAHSWVEIYLDGIGWVSVDTALLSISDTDLGFLFSTDNIDELDFEAPAEGNIVDFEAYVKDNNYATGDTINPNDIICRATYDSGDNMYVKPDKILYPDMSTPGNKEITVFYSEGDSIFMEKIPIVVDGGVIPANIALLYTNIPEVTYSGYAPYTGYTLFQLVDDKKMPISLREGDYVTFVPVFVGETSSLSSFEDVINAGMYTFRVRAVIRDEYGEDVTETVYNIKNNYTDSQSKTKAYRIIINPRQINLGTASKEITYDELMNTYMGSFYYPCLYRVESPEYQQVNELALLGEDFLHVYETNGWSTLTNKGNTNNTFDTSSIKVYRDGLDVTNNYIFVIDEVGNIAVSED